MYPCCLTPEQVKLFKEDKPYNSPFKGMNWRDFESDNGYKVGLFRVKEASGEMEEYINKTITFTGYFADLDGEAYYKLTGNYVFNERYGSQFQEIGRAHV